jgi:multiple sugar transport system ATP-binding protein
LLPPEARNGSTISAPVDVVEHLGSELMVHMTANGKPLVARLDPHSAAHTGGTLDLLVDTDSIHLFDSDTGEAIF